MFATEALHMIAAAILLDANMAFRAILCVCANVVGRFTVVGTFGQPLFDDLTFGGRVIIVAAFETER